MSEGLRDNPADILAWWRAAGRERWFGGGASFDHEVRARLLPAHEEAAAGRLDLWEDTPEGAAALLILLDQVPRNVFRATPRAFATDERARTVAGRAIARGFDEAPLVNAAPSLRGFFYLPYMHAEDDASQQRCVDLYRQAADEDGLAYALLHQEAIARFGRFPHRNPILGRAMTPAEQAYLDAGGFQG
ncbi:DUF924 family protein [Xanthobacter variabilis]|uniref:DUF924 family protein n=1 Tax=Xanthobacter variabilis TaxID=3119932 RepID=UPI00372AAC1A